MTFHGLASPNELKTTWFNMTEGQTLRGPNSKNLIPDVNVIWEFNEQTLKDVLAKDFGNSQRSGVSLFVVNCLYKINPNMVGHYVALYKKDKIDDFGNKVSDLIYFDPLATFPQKWLIERCIAFDNNIKIIVDLEGAQAINGNSCGFRCLFKLLKYCLGYMPENYAELFDDHINWYISKDNKKKALHAENVKRFIDTTIKKTKREIKTIKDLL